MSKKNDDFQIEKKLISKPLDAGATTVRLSDNRLSQIKDINAKLNSHYVDMSVTKNRIEQNKAHNLDVKQKIPSDAEVEKMKQKIDEVKKLTIEINSKSEEIKKCNQINAFLSILIEKALNAYYPDVKNGENIHENLIRSVEEDENFNYGEEISNQIHQISKT